MSLAVFESLLNLSFNVLRIRRTTDGQGGFAVDWMEISPFDGRLRPATSREREIASLEQRVITHVLYTKTDVDIERGDLVSPGVFSRDDFDVSSTDIIVKVEGIREPSTAEHHFEIDCIEYQVESNYEESTS